MTTSSNHIHGLILESNKTVTGTQTYPQPQIIGEAPTDVVDEMK
jgi:hypothetical protein